VDDGPVGVDLNDTIRGRRRGHLSPSTRSELVPSAAHKALHTRIEHVTCEIARSPQFPQVLWRWWVFLSWGIHTPAMLGRATGRPLATPPHRWQEPCRYCVWARSR